MSDTADASRDWVNLSRLYAAADWWSLTHMPKPMGWFAVPSDQPTLRANPSQHQTTNTED